jgi:hypothetical protein
MMFDIGTAPGASLTVVDSDLVLSMQPVLADDGSRDGGSQISKSRKSSACILIGQDYLNGPHDTGSLAHHFNSRCFMMFDIGTAPGARFSCPIRMQAEDSDDI